MSGRTIVLLPSAVVVSKDMQGLGRFPAIIYPIDQMRMIDFFCNHYLAEGSGDIVLSVVSYEEYEQVEKRIGRRDHVDVIRLDELRDIGHTIAYGIEKSGLMEGDSLIINFADIAVMKRPERPIKDCCVYAIEDVSSKWTYFNYQDCQIIKFYDKPSGNVSVDTKNMLIGLFQIENPLLLKELIEECQKEDNRELDSFWIALQKYSMLRPMEMVCTDEWFDIGHIDKYYDMQMAIKSRTFNHITIDRSRGILTKTSDDKEKFIGEIQWYLKLPTDVEYARPRIFSYSTDYMNPYVSMEYYAYHTLHELFLFGDLSNEQWSNVFRRIRFILNDFRRYSVRDEGIQGSLREMYLEKTLKRLKEMDGAEDFPEFNKDMNINGTDYISLEEICELLPDLIEELLMDVDEFSIIHGDLCFSNIMVDSNYSFIKLIDPRGRFGKYDIYGDRKYELAKLMHSIDGKYDYIIKDKFHLDGKKRFAYKIDYDQGADIEECFFKVFAEEMEADARAIKLIESLLFFSMIPLHKESPSQQKVMLGTAVSLLDEVSDIKTAGRRVK